MKEKDIQYAITITIRDKEDGRLDLNMDINSEWNEESPMTNALWVASKVSFFIDSLLGSPRKKKTIDITFN